MRPNKQSHENTLAFPHFGNDKWQSDMVTVMQTSSTGHYDSHVSLGIKRGMWGLMDNKDCEPNPFLSHETFLHGSGFRY
jgi:hypothetical protein